MRALRGFTVWLTGLPCSGKSTLSAELERELLARGRSVEVLDGDVVRTQLSRGLGFSREDRDSNVRRIGFVAHLLCRNGVAVVVAAVSPYREARRQVRQEVGDFVEVYVQCPLAECERRDVKGMYAQARAGKLSGFTGVDDPYEAPEHAEVVVHTADQSAQECVRAVLAKLEELGYLKSSPELPATRRPS